MSLRCDIGHNRCLSRGVYQQSSFADVWRSVSPGFGMAEALRQQILAESLGPVLHSPKRQVRVRGQWSLHALPWAEDLKAAFCGVVLI